MSVQQQQRSNVPAAQQQRAPAAQQPLPFSASLEICKEMGITPARFFVLRGMLGEHNNFADHEIGLFLLVAHQKKLDPFANQIFMVARTDKGRRKMVFITSIDGYRSTAARSSALGGISDPVFMVDDNGGAVMATVTVIRMVNGEEKPFTASARWAEFKPDAPNDHMWKKMPFHMLGKCAEAQALRKAFPQELSGLYTDDEAHMIDRQPMSAATVLNAQLTSPTETSDAEPEGEADQSVEGQLLSARDAFAKLGVTWEQALTAAQIEFQKDKEGKVTVEAQFVDDVGLKALRAFYETKQVGMSSKKAAT